MPPFDDSPTLQQLQQEPLIQDAIRFFRDKIPRELLVSYGQGTIQHTDESFERYRKLSRPLKDNEWNAVLNKLTLELY